MYIAKKNGEKYNVVHKQYLNKGSPIN